MNLPQGLDVATLSTNSNRRKFQIELGNEEHLSVITFFLGILAALYHRCDYVGKNVKEKENPESLDVSLAKVKVDCHEYFQTWS